MQETQDSIEDSEPTEEGGPDARRGFSYQDHVAAGHALGMLDSGGPVEIWCENLDDLVLVHELDEARSYELAQVKGAELDQHWSIATICHRGDRASIIERQLSHDRFLERRLSFRVITKRDVKRELRVLRMPRDGSERKSNHRKIKQLAAQIERRLGPVKSPNGRTAEFWLQRVLWEVAESEDACRAKNLHRLARILEIDGIYLAIDQREELYSRLVAKIYNLSRASWPERKLTRSDLAEWIREEASATANPRVGASHVLAHKLANAGLGDYLATAQELRLAYRRESLRPSFLTIEKRSADEATVQAELNLLKSEVDAGLREGGAKFHAECLQRLAVHAGGGGPSFAVLQGFMYELTSRCVHRFSRAAA